MMLLGCLSASLLVDGKLAIVNTFPSRLQEYYSRIYSSTNNGRWVACHNIMLWVWGFFFF